MLAKFKHIATALILLALIGTASAAEYYVDASLMTDCLGTYSITNRNCSGHDGDAYNTINEVTSSSLLQPGDEVFVREGIYKEQVSIGASGTVDSRITIKNYPSEKPIIDGSETLTEWTKCESQAVCGDNVNWQNIYYAYAPAGTETFTANLYQNDEMLSISQHPNPSDPFYMDQAKKDYLPISVDNITTTTIVDPALEGLGGTELIGAYVAIWADPNVIAFSKITGYVPAENKIVFDYASNVYRDRDSYYSILNSLEPSILDKTGEFYFNEAPEADNTHKVYVWPLNNQDLSTEGEVTVSVRDKLVHFSSYITFEGFKIQKGIGTILTTATSGVRSGQIIRNNEITKNRAAFGGTNMVYIYNSAGAIFENNHLHHNAGRLRGVIFYRGSNIKVANNIINKQGGTNIYFQTVNGGQIINNTITGSHGSHSNAISVYVNSSNILVANNIAIDVDPAFTIKGSTNITLFNNLFVGSGDTDYVIASWAGMSGTIAILNNIILRAAKTCALHGGDADYIISKNNIVDGDLDWEYQNERSHNIYTTVCEHQHKKYGWALEEGSIIADGKDGRPSIYDIFIDPDNDDFRLKEDSIAIDAGIDITADLPEYLNDPFFSDFDFDIDIEGNPRPTVSHAWDAGVYEYVLTCNFDSDCDSLDNLPCLDYVCGGTNTCTPINTDGTSCNDGYGCSIGDSCGGGDCQTGTLDNSTCLTGFSDCTSATCNPNLYPATGCGNYLPELCTFFIEDYVSYWKFDETSGTMAFDSGPGQNNGNLQGNASFVYDAERNYSGETNGNVLSLDGDGDYVTIGTGSDFSDICINGCSFSAWVNLRQTRNQNIIGRFDATDDDFFFSLTINKYEDTQFSINPNGSAGAGCKAKCWSNDVPINTWEHVVGVYNTTDVTIYRNGEYCNQETCSFSINEIAWQDSEDTFIGVYDDSSPKDYFNGLIAEVMVYDRALSEGEILRIYASQKEGQVECVDTIVLMEYISQWKQGSLGMLSLMQRLGQWKEGTGC